MRFLSRALLAGGLGLAAAFLTACGSGSDLLSSSQASALTALVNRAATDVANGECTSANNTLGTLQTDVANLPSSVNPTLVSDLSQSADTIRRLANDQCQGTAASGSVTTTTSTTTTPHPHTTPTTTTQTQTQTQTSTTTTTTTPTTTTTSPATTTTQTGTTTTTGGGAPVPGTGSGGGGAGPGNSQGQARGHGGGDESGNGIAQGKPQSD